MEKRKMLEFINILRDKYDNKTIIQEIEVLAYFAYKTVSFDTNYSELNFSNHESFYKFLINESTNVDRQTSCLLRDVIDSGIIQCDERLNKIYKEFLKCSKEEIIDILNTINESYDSSLPSTDSTLCELFTKMTRDFTVNNVLDICSGKGNLLFNYVLNNPTVTVSGYEINNVFNIISRLKLDMINANYSIEYEDVLKKKMYNRFDLVFCHYPWGMRSREELENDNIMNIDYTNIKRNRVDWAFIIKALNSINDNGKAFIIAPSGALFNSTDTITRKEIVEKGFLEMIVTMPSGTLSGTSAAYCIMVLSHNNKHVKMVDASNLYEGTRVRKKLKINEIMKLINNKGNKFLSLEELAKNDYNLLISSYIDENISKVLINPRPMEEVAEIITGFQYTSRSLQELTSNQGNVSILKINNIENGEFDINDLVSAQIDESKISKYVLRENDILVSNKGNNPKLCFINDLGNKKIIPQSNLTIIRVTSSEIEPLYLHAFLCSDTGITCLKNLMKGSVIIANISRKDLMKMNIPVLSKIDQELIINRYNIISRKLKELRKQEKNLKLKLASIYTDKVGE